MTLFLRVLDIPIDDKASALRTALISDSSPSRFEVDPETFFQVPCSPFAYWINEKIRSCFQSTERTRYVAKLGLKTDDDFRFLRLWFEVPANSADYRPLAKGGAYSPIYSDIHLRLQWRDNGWEIKSLSTERWGNPGKRIFNEGFYFRPGLTWPRRTTSGFGIRVMPAGCIFGDKGPAVFVESDSPSHLLALCAFLNSKAFRHLVDVQLAAADAAARSYEVGIIQRTPVPILSEANQARLCTLARRAWSLKRTLDTTTETSHAFVLPPELYLRITGLDREAVESEIGSIQREIDEDAFRLYGIGPDDLGTIEASSPSAVMHDEDSEGSDEGEDAIQNTPPFDATMDATTSWLVGVSFGRFDLRPATGERPLPLEPEPFDPLPLRSPGMWPEGDEPAKRADILVDDEGHVDDLVTRIRAIAERVNVAVPKDLRVRLAKEFFPLHIKMYSKSRRKAPIYWQLATPSASYSVWLYIHAFSKDAFFRVQNDYAVPKLAYEERRLDALRIELREKATSAQRAELAVLESFVEELRAFLEEIKRVAPLWSPKLDDGVLINFAPLWRIVPHHKPWQKELRSTWDSLCAGDYDWSHMAMHFWPERVVPKCASDRSIAISHGLETNFWIQDAAGRWVVRKTPLRMVEDLVQERTSPAVRSALNALLQAPLAASSGSSIRSKRRRSAANAAGGEN